MWVWSPLLRLYAVTLIINLGQQEVKDALNIKKKAFRGKDKEVIKVSTVGGERLPEGGKGYL